MLAKIRSVFRFLKNRPKRTVAVAILCATVGLNLLAYAHARAMTRFVQGGTSTPAPEKLSTLGKAGVLLTGVSLPRPENRRTPEELGLDFTTHTIDSTDDVTLEVWQAPVAEPRGVCVFFHSYASAKAELLDEAAQFHQWGHTVYLVDFRGSGGSTGRETTIGYREADDVVAVVKFVRERSVDLPIFLYGRSMGSAAILRAMAAHDLKLTAVILECPFNRLLSTAKNRFHAMGLPGFPCAELLVFWGGWQQGYSGFEHNPAEYARAADCPVLLLRGETDPRVTREQLQAIYDNLPGKKQRHEFTGLGHEQFFKSAEADWRRVVGAFVEERAPSSTSKTMAE